MLKSKTMKKLLLFVAIIGLISCDRKDCYECYLYHNYEYRILSYECDMTKRDIKRFEEAHTRTYDVDGEIGFEKMECEIMK